MSEQLVAIISNDEEADCDATSLAAINAFFDESEPTIVGNCRRCGRDDVAMDRRDVHLCQDCVKAYNSRVSHMRGHMDVTAISKDAGIDLWMQQPGETQWEYTVWVTYRDCYPGKRPSYSDVARELNITTNAVKKIAMRWNFQTRMQAWIRYTEDITLAQRRAEILDMNKEHISMAVKIRGKLNEAIDLIEPSLMKPSEISSLARTMAELERKAQVDAESQEAMLTNLLNDIDNPNLKKHQTQQGDLSEVVQILLKAGALSSVTQVTAKEITTERSVTLGLGDDEDDDYIEVMPHDDEQQGDF